MSSPFCSIAQVTVTLHLRKYACLSLDQQASFVLHFYFTLTYILVVVPRGGGGGLSRCEKSIVRY